MKISIPRLDQSLNVAGFLRTRYELPGTVDFVRTRSGSLISEWIRISCSGKAGEAVYAYSGASVTQSFLIKGLCGLKLMRELADDDDRRWTIIRSDAIAMDWEERLARTGPALAAEFAVEMSPVLLTKSEDARFWCRRYFDALSAATDERDRLGSLKRLSDPPTVKEAERLSQFAGVMQVPRSQETYFLACLALLRFAPKLQDERWLLSDLNPLLNQPLMWQIQLLADRLFCEANGPLDCLDVS